MVKNKNPEIKEGHMYQYINGTIVEVVRVGKDLLPITDLGKIAIIGEDNEQSEPQETDS